MPASATLSKTLSFFLIKIIIGIAVVAGSVALVELAGRPLLDKTQISDDVKNIIIAVADSGIALLSYVLLFSFYEKRQISELSLSSFPKNAFLGFISGFALQSLFILVIYLAGGYSIINVNPISFLLPAFATALTAGFVAEIILVGIIFRLLEEKTGTVISLLIFILIFAILHATNKQATFLSALSTALQAGFLLSAVYIFTRSLWAPIFLHFAWDLTEPGIYGAINPGNTIGQSLFTAKISGSSLVTGGQHGPQNSIQAVMACLVAGSLLLWYAKRKNKLIRR